MIASTDFVRIAETYAAAAGVELVTVSSRVFDDSKKLAAMRDAGADLTLQRARRALQWFSDNWPDGVEWPEGIERPPVANAPGAAA